MNTTPQELPSDFEVEGHVFARARTVYTGVHYKVKSAVYDPDDVWSCHVSVSHALALIIINETSHLDPPFVKFYKTRGVIEYPRLLRAHR